MTNAAAYWPYGVALADFNGDGRVDAAVAAGIDDAATVLLNVCQ